MNQKLLERTVGLAAEAGACSLEMVAADGTFIEAPSSTKNKAHARDPEMASGKKANTWLAFRDEGAHCRML